MRRLVHSLLTGIFRSRWIAAVALAVIVVGIVAMARVVAGPAPDRILDTADLPAPSVSTDPLGDDSVTTDDAPPTPKVAPGTAGPEAVAFAFASAWADHTGVSAEEWHGRLLPHMTENLSAKLAATDPEVVPADRVTGKPVLTPIGDQVAEVRVDTDAGELRLTLVAPEGRWLVDAVGWRRA